MIFEDLLLPKESSLILQMDLKRDHLQTKIQSHLERNSANLPWSVVAKMQISAIDAGNGAGC